MKQKQTRSRTTASMANSESKEARPSVFIAPPFFAEWHSCNTLLGTTVAVDLFTGKTNVGRSARFRCAGQRTGTINLGGPMVTAGGLVFTGAAMDNFLRAFDSETGNELWNYELPAGGQALP